MPRRDVAERFNPARLSRYFFALPETVLHQLEETVFLIEAALARLETSPDENRSVLTAELRSIRAAHLREIRQLRQAMTLSDVAATGNASK